MPAINAFAFFIYNLPIVGKRLLSRWYWNDNGAVILLYHQIDSQTFEKHVRWLKKYGKIISIDTLVERIERRQNLENSVVITFDDGWKSNYTEVLPVVKKYNVPIIVYLVSDTVGTEIEFWWVTGNNLRATLTSTQGEVLDSDYYEAIPNKQKNAEIREAMERLQYSAQARCALLLPEIKEMLDSNLVTFGSHSKSHPNLKMTEPEEAAEEIIGSKTSLESQLKVKIAHFAYPHGSYSKPHIDILKDGGYASAVTVLPQLNSVQADLYQLGRIQVVPQASEYTLTMMISGLWHLLGLDVV